MNDTELDALLTASRPDDEHDRDCSHCRAALTRRPARRWHRGVAAAGAAGVAVVAIGAGAAATVGLPFVDHRAPVKHTQTVSNGDRCYNTYTVSADGQHPDPASVDAARAILATLDMESLDISDDLAYYAEEYEHVEWEGPGPRPDYVYSFDSQDSLEQQALTRAVFAELTGQLTQQGMNPGAISLETESICDDAQKAIRK